MLQAVKPHYRIAWVNRLAEIPQPVWDALALSLPTPFLEWAWLNNLETSGSATAQTGWLPNHLTIWHDQTLVAAAPLYIKSHSYGEFVFDQEWADLAYRMGLNYYPKLLGMSPFTPADGYRFLIAAGQDEAVLTDLMVQEIDQFCQRNQLFGCHFLFVDPQWRMGMEQRGFGSWLHHSYIWSNQGFDSFETYLSAFNANQRRNIKRERKAVVNAGVNLDVVAGTDIPDAFYPLMHRFYSETCDKFMWGSKYLTRQFFRQLYPDYAHRVMFVAAYAADYGSDPLGMSFCITKGDRLYGRYWGCTRELDCLHFDACYYTPIEWAIAKGIQHFDPGAGGRHKKRRGFPATPNYSLHRFYHPRFTQIFNHYIGDINQAEQQAIDQINQELPFNRLR